MCCTFSHDSLRGTGSVEVSRIRKTISTMGEVDFGFGSDSEAAPAIVDVSPLHEPETEAKQEETTYEPLPVHSAAASGTSSVPQPKIVIKLAPPPEEAPPEKGVQLSFTSYFRKLFLFVAFPVGEGERARRAKSRHPKAHHGDDEDEDEEIHGRPARYADSEDEHGHTRTYCAVARMHVHFGQLGDVVQVFGESVVENSGLEDPVGYWGLFTLVESCIPQVNTASRQDLTTVSLFWMMTTMMTLAALAMAILVTLSHKGVEVVIDTEDGSKPIARAHSLL